MEDRYASQQRIGGVALSELKFVPSERRKNAAILAAGYSPAKRRFEVCVLTTFYATWLFVLWRALAFVNQWSQLWVVAVASVCGALTADVISGFLHWTMDTWGSLETWVVGPTFVRSFREHHVDPLAMTRHDFVETNGDSCVPALPIIVAMCFWSVRSDFDVYLMVYWLVTALVASHTNELHKWAHQVRVPAWVAFLQRNGLILSRKHHNTHHRPPFDKAYCITAGWLNNFMDYISFWRRLEAAITLVTGVQPRQDDKRWTGQLAYAANKQREADLVKASPGAGHA